MVRMMGQRMGNSGLSLGEMNDADFGGDGTKGIRMGGGMRNFSLFGLSSNTTESIETRASLPAL
jgi:hypothetical protein